MGDILYYARAVDLTVITALSTIATEQSTATSKTVKNVEQLLDYLAMHPNTTLRLHASNMVLKIHSDASYLSKPGARSRASGHFFLGWFPKCVTNLSVSTVPYSHYARS